MFLQIMALSTLYARELCLLYFSNSGFVSNLYYTFIIIVVVWLGVSVFLTKTKEERNHLLLVFLIEIALMLYALFSSAQKRPVDANKMIGRIIALVLLHAIYRNNSRPSEGILKYNTVLNIIYAWSLLLLYAMGRGYDASGNLSFSFGNPNSTGLFVLLTIYSLIAGRACFIGLFSKLAIDSSIIAASVILYQSRSRSAMLSLLMFFLLWLFKTRKQNEIWSFSSGILVGLQAFAIAYPSVWAAIYGLVSNKAITFLGKPLFSAREIIWGYMYTELLQNPFAIRLGESLVVASGAHNAFLAVWWDCGFFAFFGFHIILFFFYQRLNKRCASKFDVTIVALVLSLFVSMTFEVLMFSGGVNFMFRAYYLLFFLGLFNDEQKKRFRIKVCFGSK